VRVEAAERYSKAVSWAMNSVCGQAVMRVSSIGSAPITRTPQNGQWTGV